MPSRSKAQFAKMGQLYKEGKITREQLEDFNKGIEGAKYDKLPEHVKPKKKAATHRKRTTKTRK